MSAPRKESIEVEVRYAETDQMGVVHHANYIVWFELARTHLCSRSGFHYAAIEEMGYLLMVTRAEADYRRAARYGEVVRVDCWVEKLSSRTLRFAYEVHGPAGLLTRGATEHVWVRRTTGRPCRLPRELEGPFRELAG